MVTRVISSLYLPKPPCTSLYLPISPYISHGGDARDLVAQPLEQHRQHRGHLLRGRGRGRGRVRVRVRARVRVRIRVRARVRVRARGASATLTLTKAPPRRTRRPGATEIKGR